VNRQPLIGLVAVLLALVVGVALRTRHLDTRPLWVDEAESSINALSILEHGVPTDTYLGLPIFENTHVWMWPDNPEYEFRDISYSERGLAVYHGWLPLYSIAASFAVHGIKPDLPDGARAPKYSLSDQKRRTRAARLPAVLFGAMFLVVVFAGANVMYGRDAAFAAMFIAVIYPSHLIVSVQARYYSAQFTFTAACCVLLWLVVSKCEWKHVLLAGCCYVLLFHTHLLGFVTAAVMFCLSMPLIIRRHTDWMPRIATFLAVVLSGTLPWIVATDFHHHQSRIPRAWPLLQMPGDLLRFPPFNLRYAVLGAIAMLAVLLATRGKMRASVRVAAPLRALGPVVLLTMTWAAIGYAIFLLSIPAVSFTPGRLNFSYWGPLYILFACAGAAVARILLPGAGTPIRCMTAAILMFGAHLAAQMPLGNWREAQTLISTVPVRLQPVPGSSSWDLYQKLFQHISGMHLDAGTRLYASPNAHLVLTFYSGLPIQDITPVRKSFLDSYKGDLVYIDLGPVQPTGLLDPERIRDAASQNGVNMSIREAQDTSVLLYTRHYRQTVAEMLSPGQPVQLEPVPLFLQSLWKAHHAKVTADFSQGQFDIVTAGQDIHNWFDWVSVFKYRFVDLDSRRGANTNFAQRLRNSDAVILGPSGDAAVFRSRWHPPLATAPIAFRIIRSE
jgi:hypothetical protein